MLKQISIKNYRNLDTIQTELNDKTNVIIAPNGSGKTNLLEAIYYGAFGEPFRSVEVSSQVLGQSEVFSKILLVSEDNQVEIILSLDGNSFKRKFNLNNKKVKISDLSKYLPVVLFAPNSVDLVSREPNVRRRDLDNFLGMISQEYKENTDLYEKVLKNRNALVKAISNSQANRSELQFWTDKLVSIAENIFIERLRFFRALDEELKGVLDQFKELDKTERITSLQVDFMPNIEGDETTFKTNLAAKFADNIEKEIIVGRTLYGIHKDDYRVVINEENMRYMGSRGQQRIGALVVKLAQINYYKRFKDATPLFLIDDIMSELDDYNRELVANILISQDLQFILTSADEDEVPKTLMSNGNLIELRK